MALAFVCFGISLGIFLDRWYIHFQATKQQTSTNPQEKVTLDALVRFFNTQMQLSPEQSKRFKVLLKKHLARGLTFFRNRPPEVDRFLKKGMKIREEFREAMRSILNTKQKKIFNRMVRQADMRRFELHFQRIRFQKEIMDAPK
jgi:hypothetical protein